MVERFYLRLHDVITCRPFVSAATALAVAMGLSAGIARITLDMSFRPFFAESAAETLATDVFARDFGQPSGAYIGAIVRHPRILSHDFLRRVERASAAAARIEHVAEVSSLTRVAVPVGTPTGAAARWLVPPVAYANATAPIQTLSAALEHAPALRQQLLSPDGQSTLIAARLDLPLQDLDARRTVIAEFRRAVTAAMDDQAELNIVGLSVVEDGYRHIVMVNLSRSVVLSLAAIVIVLALLFRRRALVLIPLAGVALATPATLGLMGLLGIPLTMLSSLVPVIILVIGVADSIHMVLCFQARLGYSDAKAAAIRGMFGEMGLPCLLTAFTTAIGFAALMTARIGAIREFGLAAALGVIVVYALNLVLIPLILRWAPVAELRSGRSQRTGMIWDRLGAVVNRRAWSIVTVFVLIGVAGAVDWSRLQANQRFNEELAPSHPLRQGQEAMERDFGGFLGPEILVRPGEGVSVTDPATMARIDSFQRAIAGIPGVLRVESMLNYLPAGTAPEHAAAALSALSADTLLGTRVRGVVSIERNRAALIVRTADIGSRRAHTLVATIDSLQRAHLAPVMQATVVGEWWLAQRGLDNIIRDMVAAFATSCFFVLPLMGLALRSVRLFLIAILPNILPVLFALSFMAMAGISLRVGTAMVLAIALGIAVDDTIHLMTRLRQERGRHPSPLAELNAAFRETGAGLVCSTVVLVLGFLSMTFNELGAIRDMGIVAAATLAFALLCDLLLGPALYLLSARIRSTTTSSRALDYVVARRPAQSHAAYVSSDP